MYRAVDTLPAWRAFIYFTTMIFFLSWLVKNVFIAVITETFNEIRVQFQAMWGARGSQLADMADARVISGDDRGWKLVPIDASRQQYRTVLLFLPVLNSAAFHLLLMAAILTNGILTATMTFKHDGRPRSDFYQQYYYIEVFIISFFIFICSYCNFGNIHRLALQSSSTWKRFLRYGVWDSEIITVELFTNLNCYWLLEQLFISFHSFTYQRSPTSR